MKVIFTVELQGYGHNVESAWRDATEAFSSDPGDTPHEDWTHEAGKDVVISDEE